MKLKAVAFPLELILDKDTRVTFRNSKGAEMLSPIYAIVIQFSRTISYKHRRSP